MSIVDDFLRVQDLFGHPGRRSFAAKPEMDPLTEDDSLTESQLLALRFNAGVNSFGLLLDLRQSIQLRSANTGVLIVHEVERFSWQQRLQEIEKQMMEQEIASSSGPLYRGWSVIASEPRPTEHFNLKLLFAPGAEMSVSGASAEFFMGKVAGIGGAAVSFAESSSKEIDASLPHWDSRIEVLYATFLDRREP